MPVQVRPRLPLLSCNLLKRSYYTNPMTALHNGPLNIAAASNGAAAVCLGDGSSVEERAAVNRNVVGSNPSRLAPRPSNPRPPCVARGVHLGVAQLVARLIRIQEVAGSNPVAQTKRKRTDVSTLRALAQLAEQLPLKETVAGSTPVRTTTKPLWRSTNIASTQVGAGRGFASKTNLVGSIPTTCATYYRYPVQQHSQQAI